MFLTKHRFMQVQYPAYSSTFPYFLNWKCISRVRFEDVEDIKRNMIIALLPIMSKVKFQWYFDKWKTHWNKCVDCQRDYFEENISFIVHC